MNDTNQKPHPPHHHIGVIGAGFSGLGLATRLRAAGIDDFIVLERADDLGGTWRDNTYPGAACDVQSALYCYSFAPNPTWSRSYADQPEIHHYLSRVASRFDLRRHIRTRSELLSATWNDNHHRWHLTTTTGDLTVDVLVSATGTLSDPAIPPIPGMDTFQGNTFHSARWNHPST